MSIRNDQIRNLSDITDSMLNSIQNESSQKVRHQDARVKNRGVKDQISKKIAKLQNLKPISESRSNSRNNSARLKYISQQRALESQTSLGKENQNEMMTTLAKNASQEKIVEKENIDGLYAGVECPSMDYSLSTGQSNNLQKPINTKSTVKPLVEDISKILEQQFLKSVNSLAVSKTLKSS